MIYEANQLTGVHMSETRDGKNNPATSKRELFIAIVNTQNPLTIVAKKIIHDATALRDPSQVFRFIKSVCNNFFIHLVQYCLIYPGNNLTVPGD